MIWLAVLMADFKSLGGSWHWAVLYHGGGQMSRGQLSKREGEIGKVGGERERERE